MFNHRTCLRSRGNTQAVDATGGTCVDVADAVAWGKSSYSRLNGGQSTLGATATASSRSIKPEKIPQ